MTSEKEQRTPHIIEEEYQSPPEIVAKVREITATYVDTFHISTWAGHVRITFGEVVGDETSFRVAVVLPLEDGEGLIRLLTEMVGKERQREKSR